MTRAPTTTSGTQLLVERAHRELLAASVPPAVAAAVAELERQRRSEGSAEPPPPAYEAFLEGLSEDFPPLSKGVLEAFEGELMRIRHESLAASARASRAIEANRSTLREAVLSHAAGSTASAKGARRASELALLSADAAEDAAGEKRPGAPANHAAAEMLLETAEGSDPGLEEWLKEAAANIVDVWDGTREALGALAVDCALNLTLERRVSAFEGVRSSDQDICQLAQKMAELQSTLDPGRLSKRNKSSTHLLDAEKNRNACQAAYMRALKRLKEQLKHWREACGCGFDPNLLSDVSRQALNDLRRGGGAGAKIEHILPHLDGGVASTGGGGGGTSIAGSRAASPDLFGSKQARLSSQDTAAATAGAASAAAAAAAAAAASAAATSASATGKTGAEGGSADVVAAAQQGVTEATLGPGAGGPSGTVMPPPEMSAGAIGGGAMLSIANPGLVASSAAAPMSASKIGGGGGLGGGPGGVQSFRGRGGAFGMLLHKVQTNQTSSATAAAAVAAAAAVSLPGTGLSGGGGGGAVGAAVGGNTKGGSTPMDGVEGVVYEARVDGAPNVTGVLP